MFTEDLMTRSLMMLLPLAALVGCDGDLFTIRIQDEATTTVEKGTVLEELAGDFGFGDFVSMDITESAALQNQGVEPGDIQNVRLEYMQLEATAPSGADLSFFSSMEIYVEAPDLPRMLIASASDFPEGEALIDMTIEDADLTDYATSQSMTFDVDVNAQRPSEDTDVTSRFSVAVGVTGQGVRNQTNRDE